MKHLITILTLLIGFLVPCVPKDELPAIDGFDIETLTRDNGWLFDSVCTLESQMPMLKLRKQTLLKYAKDKPVLELMDANFAASAMITLMVFEKYFGKKSTLGGKKNSM